MSKASERIVGLYEDNAGAWDETRSRELIEKSWLDRFTAPLPPGATILDIGCGMGEPIARHLIESGFRVTGLDSSPSLIAMGRERFPDHEWIVGDMRKLALGRRFDGLIAWHSSFHLSPADQRKLFPLLASHANPGGSLMFTSGPEQGEAIGEWQGEPLYHGSLSQDEYRALLEENGFEVVEHACQDPSCGGATVWMAQIRPPNGLDGSA
jgi:SAM-dependent methyltransferase